jgi:hypothetical protein
MTGTLHEDQYTFLIISHLILLQMKNVSDKIVGEIKSCILCPVSFFFFNLAIYEIMWKNLIGPDRPQMTM